MRIALGLSYDGTSYQGWQSQPSGLTIQDRLEAALAEFATGAIRVHCAGRTDAGVHALMQVVHFDTEIDRVPFSWVRGTNRFLPADIAIQWAQVVPETFGARASALARRYSYVVLESPVRPSLDAHRVGWSFRVLNVDAMRAAARHLLGEHDFTSFRASACEAPSPVKRMEAVEISRRGAYLRFDFRANAFLYHMIRNIMGCLIAIGQGLRPPDWMGDVLRARDRDAAAPTYAPDGLYFCGPVYAPAWGLPERTAAYDWLP